MLFNKKKRIDFYKKRLQICKIDLQTGTLIKRKSKDFLSFEIKLNKIYIKSPQILLHKTT